MEHSWNTIFNGKGTEMTYFETRLDSLIDDAISNGVTEKEIAETLKAKSRMLNDDDVWIEHIRYFLNGAAETNMRDVLTNALSIDPANQTRAEQIRAGKAMAALGYNRVRVRNGAGLHWVYRK